LAVLNVAPPKDPRLKLQGNALPLKVGQLHHCIVATRRCGFDRPDVGEVPGRKQSIWIAW